MIRFSRVSKRFGDATALNELDFSVPAGQTTVLLGPNGAGKSTALRILVGLERAHSGSATVCGLPYRQLKDPLRSIGVALGGSGAHPSRTGRTHLAWLALSNGIPMKRVDDVIDLLDLRGVCRKQTGDYSLGMASRLGLAGALLGSPSCLVLDEPLNGLDVHGTHWFGEFIREFAAMGGATLMSSHDIVGSSEIATHAVIVVRGRIVRQGTIAEVARGYRSLEAAYRAYTGDVRNRGKRR